MSFRQLADLDLIHIRHGVAHCAPEHVGARRPRRHRFVNESQYHVPRPRRADADVRTGMPRVAVNPIEPGSYAAENGGDFSFGLPDSFRWNSSVVPNANGHGLRPCELADG